MKSKVIICMALSLFLIGVLALTFSIQPVKAEPVTIYIRADGSIDPPTANITSTDNVTYTLTGNITTDGFNNGIVVERNNTVLDGAGSSQPDGQERNNHGFLDGHQALFFSKLHNIRK